MAIQLAQRKEVQYQCCEMCFIVDMIDIFLMLRTSIFLVVEAYQVFKSKMLEQLLLDLVLEITYKQVVDGTRFPCNATNTPWNTLRSVRPICGNGLPYFLSKIVYCVLPVYTYSRVNGLYIKYRPVRR